MYKIMIVEDEWLVREGLKMTIPWEQMGFELAGEASDGLAALDLLGELSPDVVLTDIRMPALDGIGLAEKVAERLPFTKIVFLTGFDDFAYAQKAVKLGAADFVLKPTNPDELQHVFGRVRAKLDRERPYRAQAERDLREQGRESGGFHSIEAYIREHYGEEITLQEMADRHYMSESHFSRLFKQQVGTSFLEYLTTVRVEKAKELLMNPKLKIYEVSVRVGYQDSRYFSQIYRKYTGETPTEFRKRLGIEYLPL
ncbi:helix-turn-helix domain-containing protein [Paenibacillus hamazuiensis]|uniref:helix-turn-helix domain-containing protein n=1 Tax=Paenibacillus hamazuiensis TaxID=2936508 RepID=UPI00200FEC95|nr:helix-turn-helix domain-containing protein [Paenibacillus hamazuiensis]